MRFVCLERLQDEEECEGFVYSDFNLYMEVEEKEEEEVRKYLTELLKRFKFLKRGETKEVCIFLTNTTKLKALQFSTRLKQQINKKRSLPQNNNNLPDTLKPDRVIGISRKNGIEKITVYDVDKKSKIHYITSVDLPADTLTRLKEITEDFRGLS